MPFIFAGFLALASNARAQDSQARPIGRIIGGDISVEGGLPGTRTANATPQILLTNGSVVTVHSGNARITLDVGGTIDICGPAKLTLLQAGRAITVALNFGQVRTDLPASADLRIFTPTIIATPLDISGASRDVTLGLSLDDSLCVVASGGAIQLEHQFSGEKLIVPQAGEFFLAAGKLVPLPGNPGSCQCVGTPTAHPIPEPSPEISQVGLTAPPETVKAQPATPPQPTPGPESQPNVEVSVLAQGNDAKPVTAEKNVASISPPASVPVYTVVAPALTFDAHSPSPPPEPPVDTFLLVRQAQVDPEWEFKGHVDPPGFAAALQNALGEGTAAKPNLSDEPTPPKKKHRVWSFFKKIFVGDDQQH